MSTTNHAKAPPRLKAAECAWFLDIDGTLIELAGTPQGVHIDAAIVETLGALAEACSGALALVSGRRLEEIDSLFSPLRLPAAGLYGLQWRGASGTLHSVAPGTDFLQRTGMALREWAASRPGVVVEDKGITLAVHFRQAPHQSDAVRNYLKEVVGAREEYRLQRGKMVFEIVPAAADKGAAVREFMRDATFTGRKPVFVGDDATDEHAFTVVDRLGGVGVKVGPGASVARWRLQDVPAVRAWIQSSIALQDAG